MTSVRTLAMMTMLIAAAPALAQPREDGVVSLSPAERAAAIDAGSRQPVEAFEAETTNRRPHGEVGMEIGSNGGRALYGATVVPLGQTGYASFSFLTAQSGRWRGR